MFRASKYTLTIIMPNRKTRKVSTPQWITILKVHKSKGNYAFVKATRFQDSKTGLMRVQSTARNLFRLSLNSNPLVKTTVTISYITKLLSVLCPPLKTIPCHRERPSLAPSPAFSPLHSPQDRTQSFKASTRSDFLLCCPLGRTVNPS